MNKKVLRVLAVVLIGLAVLLFLFRESIARRIFVTEYTDVIEAYSNAYDVPQSLVKAVIWCESKFCKDAVSSANAFGLMQLTEPTFRELLADLQLPSHCDIFSPEYNIRCGVYYLHKLYGMYGSWETALAAYNAGMGNVNEWLADPLYSNDGKKLQTVPYKETKEYVRKVLDVKEIYEKLYQT